MFVAIPSILNAPVSGSPSVRSVDSAQEMSSAIRGLGLWKKARRQIFAKRVSVCFYGDQPRLSSLFCRDENRNSLPFSWDISDPTGSEYRETYVTRDFLRKVLTYIILSLFLYILFSPYLYIYFIISYILIYKIILFYYFNYIFERGANRSSLEYLRK